MLCSFLRNVFIYQFFKTMAKLLIIRVMGNIYHASDVPDILSPQNKNDYYHPFLAEGMKEAW